MINEENINKIYECLINGNELTTKELNSYGFNSTDLNKLIEQGKLERVTRGHYKLLTIEELFYYGKKLLAEKDYDKALKCFEKCYELDNNHPGSNFQLFFQCIKNKQYEESFKYVETLLNVNNNYYKKDINYYIYLLNIITELPPKYKEYAKNLTYIDIKALYNDKRFEDIEVENKIRTAVIQHKFSDAYKLLIQNSQKKGYQNSVENLSRILLIAANNRKNKNYKELLKLIKDKKYHEAITILENKSQVYDLNTGDSYTLILLKTILEIKNTNRINSPSDIKAFNVFQAIDLYDYESALKLNEDFNKEKNIKNAGNIMHILLTEICNLKKELLPSKDEITDPMIDIINSLMKVDISSALEKINKYLSSMNKSNYEFIVVNLIKISILKKDTHFVKPINALIQISEGSYRFNLSEFSEEFFQAVSNDKFEEANTYLNIIKNADKIGIKCAYIESLNAVLKFIESANTVLEISKEPTTVIEENSDTQIKPASKETSKLSEKTNEAQAVEPIKKQSIVSEEDINNDKKLIESNYNRLKERKGIVLLNPMSEERIERVSKIIEEYSDITSFIIGEGREKQIVLKYCPNSNEYINIPKLLKQAQEAYNEENYDKCIECYLKLIELKKVKTFVYAKLGLSYLKKGYKNTAIEYLTVANELNKMEKGQFDYSELIISLKGIPKEEKKPTVIFKAEEFENNQENFGITNIDNIKKYISESDLDVESACVKLKLNEEQRTRIKLLYAIEYYSQGEYAIGDEFLLAVERNKNKSNFVKKQIEEVKRRKKFYINRNNTPKKQLKLTLKPQ